MVQLANYTPISHNSSIGEGGRKNSKHASRYKKMHDMEELAYEYDHIDLASRKEISFNQE